MVDGRRDMGSTYNYSAVKHAPDDGGSGAGGFWQWHTAGVQGGIAGVVGEVESRHGDERSSWALVY